MLLVLGLLCSGCSRLGLFGGRPSGILDVNDVEKLRLAYQQGELESLTELIAIYNDSKQPDAIRIEAGKALADSHHPVALAAISTAVQNATALDLTFMLASIELLARFKDNPKAAQALVEALHSVDKQTNAVHTRLVRTLGRIRTRDQVLALLDLYEASQARHARLEQMLTETLGALGDDEVIPALMAIARNPKINVGIRNRAIEILGKKQTADVVSTFAELLQDPQTNLEVRDFALNTMAGVRNEGLILALLETYNLGKQEYFSLLNTLLDALGEFDDPEVKAAVIEIALSSDYPAPLRQKALRSLAKFGDPAVIDRILPLLSQSANYHLYEPIRELVRQLDPQGRYSEQIRRLAFEAHRRATAGE